MSCGRAGEEVTHLLEGVANGQAEVRDELYRTVYAELRAIAARKMASERTGHTLQPTALVHEAYARLLRQDQPDYQNRAHFLGVAAQVMRQILIDHARTKNAEKRGGGRPNFSVDEATEIAMDRPSELIAIDDALNELARTDAIKAKLIEMRFFGGLTAEESAEALQMTVNDVRRHLRVAQAWLKRELDRTAPTGA